MDLHKVSKSYLRYSVVSFIMIPFTGVVALNYALKARFALQDNAYDETHINELLSLCYKWLKISVITIAVAFPVLVLSFLLYYQFTAR